jgi:hypothetical protein
MRLAIPDFRTDADLRLENEGQPHMTAPFKAPLEILLLALLAGCGAADRDGLAGAGTAAGDAPFDTGVTLPEDILSDGSGDANGRACAGITIAAENQRGPADIIFALDNSGSMVEEAGFVQENMNGFSQQIVAASVDARVVVISGYPRERMGPGPPNNGVCIDAPLGSGGCPTADTNLPGFLHVNQGVDSNNALELVIASFPEYRDTLRPEAQKHLVVVTDDESNLSATAAKAGLLALDPPTFDRFIFHGIFAFSAGNGDQCEGLAAAEGAQYRELAQDTGGVSSDLCLQDFEPVFARLAEEVVGRARLACQWEIPPPPSGTSFDPALTNVRFSSPTIGSRDVARSVSASDCAAARDGWAWHYDDEESPGNIMLCPDACALIQSESDATVDVELGCPTRYVLR